MSTGGTLFAVSVGMSLKEELTLHRLPYPHVLKLSICFWRHVGNVTRADLRKYGVTIGCAACSDIAANGKQNLTQKNVGPGLASNKVTNICESTPAGEMRNLRLKGTRRRW